MRSASGTTCGAVLHCDPAVTMTSSPRRASIAGLITLATLAGRFLPASDEAATTTAPPSAAARGGVVVLRVDSIIHPVAHEYVVDGLEEAESSKADAVVIEIDTPGGLLDSTHEITTAMLGADLPVVVFVEPSGARAASAGFFILMAADVAAMAPGTNTGAAHPVGARRRRHQGHHRQEGRRGRCRQHPLARGAQRAQCGARPVGGDREQVVHRGRGAGTGTGRPRRRRPRRPPRRPRRSHRHQERRRARAPHRATRSRARSR